MDDPAARLRGSLAGEADRVRDNGLGFDQTRLGSLQDMTEPWVDPVVEVLAFFGLALLPVRGPGTDGRLGRSSDDPARQRGWRQSATAGEPQRCQFHWPAWSQPLDRDGIDALLDAWSPEREDRWTRLGVHAAWRGVSYVPRGKERTCAIGAVRPVTLEPVVRFPEIEHFAGGPRPHALIQRDGVGIGDACTVRGIRTHGRVDAGQHRHERGRDMLLTIPLASSRVTAGTVSRGFHSGPR